MSTDTHFAADRPHSAAPIGAGLSARAAGPMRGDVRVPGDKSISHRALILGACAVGETTITGLLEGEDVLCTAAAMRAFGARVTRTGAGEWTVRGVGVGGLAEPARVLDMGNSGTGARLVMGLAAAHPFTTFFAGDASLSGRPMERVMAPLRQMGAAFAARSGGRLPLAVQGSASLVPIDYELPVASAQVKSAVLLAGLNTAGATTVVEPKPTRDHTELMLRHFGAEVTVEDLAGGGRRVTLTGQPELTARGVAVPSDISSAAFPLAAALLVAGSEVVVRGVGMNPLRTGLVDTLREMGADLRLMNERTEAGEPVADLAAKAGPLKAVTVPASRAPAMIDEYPILAVAAAFASGTTRMEGLGELRVKESDRLAAVAAGLTACGVAVKEGPDWLEVTGSGGKPVPGGATVAVHLDHRIAMAFLVLGLASADPVAVDDGSPIATSFPGFVDLMRGLGADILEGEARA